MATTDPTPHRRPLAGLLISQFFGAFNDNALKLMVPLLAIAALTATTPDAGEAQKQAVMTMAFVIFTLPLMLCSLPAGLIADRFSKRNLVVAMKALELVLVGSAAAILFLAPGVGGTQQTLLLVVLGLMGLQSAIFSPAKYGLLPELLPREKLSEGNGKLEMSTFLAIVAGTGAAGALLDFAPTVGTAALPLVAFSIVGLVASFAIPRVPPARPEPASLADVVRGAWRAAAEDRVLRRVIIGSTLYWGIASLVAQNVLVYAKSSLGLADAVAGVPLALTGIGIGVGAMLAGKLSHDKVETGLIPFGAIGLSVFTLCLGFGPGFVMTGVLMTALGVASGFILVPIEALLQARAPAERRGAVIAFANFFTFGGVIAGTLGAYALSAFDLDGAGIFIGAAVITGAATAWALWILPDALFRFGMIVLTNTIYRLKVIGRTNVPTEGGALLVPNHVSFIDGLFLMASIDRPVRFIVHADYFHHPILRPFMKAIGAIPIADGTNPKETLRALKNAGQALDDGEVVCIFAEGQITRNGVLQPFKRGLERIIKGRSAPVVPVYLSNVWGSIFSREGGRFFFKWPRRIPYHVSVAYGEPIEAATFRGVRHAVHRLGERAATINAERLSSLHALVVNRARRGWRRFAVADSSGVEMHRGRVLTGAVALARALREEWDDQPHVGLLLPPSAAGVTANLAASLAGRTSVNLNYTTGRASLESAVQQAGLRTVLTSRQFVERAKLELPDGVRPIWLEDLRETITGGDRLRALLAARFLPLKHLERFAGAPKRVTGDDVATIIFSSGSTGDPKGVELTHRNVGSNAAGVSQLMQTDRHDRLLGILPLFHSFGYMATWFAMADGIGLVCHPNPLDAGAVGALVSRHRVTLMIATPTFLQRYTKRCTPAQLGSLRLIIAGAEKLTAAVANGFEDTFGIRPLEGYGTTECSPVIAASAPDFRAPGFFQPGSRRGSVGQPLTSVSIRIVDPETGDVQSEDEPGLILVRGPGVMKGYLGRDDLTDKAMVGDYYSTGDIGYLDDDGFLYITDRLSRFSKIGGEMVPHGTVEKTLQDASGESERVIAVTALPDPKKGERLVVVHTLDEAKLPALLDAMTAAGLPAIYRPRPDHFVRVETLPLLGTGKLDLRGIREAAENALG